MRLTQGSFSTKQGMPAKKHVFFLKTFVTFVFNQSLMSENELSPISTTIIKIKATSAC